MEVNNSRSPEIVAPAAQLFRDLNNAGIRYCHWKGTFGIRHALLGDKDLDLLVDPADASDFARICRETGFKAMVSIDHTPEFESHLFALDETTGSLVHLHVHFDLALPKLNPRGIRLPWREVLLDTRRFDSELGVNLPDPTVEFVIFVARAALGLDVLRRLRLRRSISLGARRIEEFHWLASRADNSQLPAIGGRILGTTAIHALEAIAHSGPRPDLLVLLRHAMRPSPEELATRSQVASASYWTRKQLSRTRSRLDARRMRAVPKPIRRIPGSGGKLIAILGVDGSGKTTTTEAVASWLSNAVDVYPAYLGGGKQATSLTRRVLRAINAPRKKRPRKKSSNYAHPGQAAVEQSGKGVQFRLRQLWFASWALSLAKVRLKYMLKARKARRFGMVVVSDRYPQIQSAGLGDGVLLEPWLSSSSSLLRKFALNERRLFGEITETPPDMVIILDVELATAASRRPRMDLGLLERKAEVIARLVFPPATIVHHIDANSSHEEVLLAVKRKIWQIL
jgi:hypothetical protein